MGNNKSFHSSEDILIFAIQKNDISKIHEVIQNNTQILSKILTQNTKHTALMRAVHKGNLDLTKFFIQKGAQINKVNQKLQTALSIATRRCHLQIVEFLIEKGADVNHICSFGFKIIQLAILPGFYTISKKLYEKMEQKQLRIPEEYYSLAKKYSYRYVNYQIFLTGLVENRSQDSLNDFLKKQKILLEDPVINPNQTWKQWVFRVIHFKDAPLVERESLPENMQPQNRFLGKFHYYFNQVATSPTTQKSVLHPSQKNKKREYMSQIYPMQKKSIVQDNEEVRSQAPM